MAVQPFTPPEQMIPDFSLEATDGRRIRFSDYRGQRNLVVAYVGDSSCDTCWQFLSGLAGRYRDYMEADAEVLAVVRGSVEEARRVKSRDNLPFPVLADMDGRASRAAGALSADDRCAAALYITDLYGEISVAYRSGEGMALPSPEPVLERLQFIEIQCPE